MNGFRLKVPASEGDLPKTVPDDVYFSQIDALHADASSMFIGSVGSYLILFYVACITASPYLVAITALIPWVLGLRFFWTQQFARRRASIVSRTAMARWEQRYALASTCHVACLGVGTLVAITTTTEEFSRMAWCVTSVIYMAGIAGRNFASRTLVLLQLLVGLVPIALGWAIIGGNYILLTLSIIPAIAGSYLIAKRLRHLLLGAVLSARENAQTAAQFDAALNNMPHGLWMFGRDGRLIVANDAGSRLLRIEPWVRGTTVDDTFKEIVANDRFTLPDVGRLRDAYEARRRGSELENLSVETKDGQFLFFSIHALEEGASIVLVEDTTVRRKAESAIHDLAKFDPLTRLLNRSAFETTVRESLERIAWRSESLALFFVDLDHFKSVNDTLGHQRGDALLRMVAERLREVVRDVDAVGRFGGDEFVILQSRVMTQAQSRALAERVVSALGTPFDLNGHIITLGASVGIAMAPRDGTDVDSMMKNADMALYRAKSAGRNCWQFFERAMDLEVHARRLLEDDIRSAIASESFEVHFQPIYLTRTRRMAGAEALIRLTHPERGPIPPSKFVAVMEELGLIAEAGRMVLEKACRVCATWPRHLRVAVNLSAHQFKRDDIVGTVIRVLGISGLQADRLELEITESALLEYGPETTRCLDQLRSLGVRISLDDFGTGYSSLSYLHRFPIDKLKIDRSFLNGIEQGGRSLTLLRHVAQLSRNLGLRVVVEGVESEAQMALIVAEGTIDEVQGFLFSKAVPADEMALLIERDAAQLDAG